MSKSLAFYTLVNRRSYEALRDSVDSPYIVYVNGEKVGKAETQLEAHKLIMSHSEEDLYQQLLF